MSRIQRAVAVACATCIAIGAVGGCLHSPVDRIAGATPKSQRRDAASLTGTYTLARSPQAALTAAQFAVLGHTVSHTGDGGTAGLPKAITVLVPAEDEALQRYGAAWAARLSKQGVSLQLKPVSTLLIQSGLAAGKPEIVLSASDVTAPFADTLADVLSFTHYEMR